MFTYKKRNAPRLLKRLVGMLCVSLLSCFIQAQEAHDLVLPAAVVKSNLLYDVTATFNLGMEFRFGRELTLDIPVNYNPWAYANGRSIKHWLVQPELRYWVKESFHGHFLGLHLHGAEFNISKIIDDYRYEGWLAGAGVSLGYRWNLSSRWGIELTAGAGYAYVDYTKYTSDGISPDGCRTCGRKLASDVKHYWGATKAGLSISYTIGKTSGRKVVIDIEDTELSHAILPSVHSGPSGPPIVLHDTITVPSNGLQYRHQEGSACVLFPVNKYDLHLELGNNSEELAEIGRSLQIVRQISEAKIEKITIEAYASPEGDLDHNIVLSEKRSEALRDYISYTYGIDRSYFTVRSRGENWAGLRTVISASELLTSGEKTDILRILDLQDLPTRKTLLKEYNGGKIYAALIRGVYPMLRTCKYRIDYTVPIKE
jgi:hypothetical protein